MGTKPPTRPTGNAYPTNPPTSSTGNAYPTHPTPSTGNAYGIWSSPYTHAPWDGYNKWFYGNSWYHPQSPPKQTPLYAYNKRPATKPPTRPTGNAYPTHLTPSTGNAYGIWGSPYTQGPWYGYSKWSQPQSPPKQTPLYGYNKWSSGRLISVNSLPNRPPQATATPFYRNSFFSHYPVYKTPRRYSTYRYHHY